ncbi:hypothetical protein C1H46_030671 [Malus baccata]|uniref:Replication protein A C-terminal domain-containing protein n=1 Tax=Malus baccata TaxID=106549 RepID=A0A540LBG6_MALBA|nr:hypothetical protein C1H46_030671 [Malus baccata]
MFSGSQFDATNAFSGGGFMASQSTQFGDSTPSPAKRRETHGLVPVTVKQISEAHQSGDEKSNFVISGADVANVHCACEHIPTLHLISLKQDNDGFIIVEMSCNYRDFDLALKFLNFLGDSPCPLSYVEVFGRVCKPVKNFDEVAFHFIECIHTHLLTSKLELQGNAATQAQPMDSSLNTPVRSGSTGYQTAPSNQFSGQVSVDGLKSCDQLVLDYLQHPSSMPVKNFDEVAFHFIECIHTHLLTSKLELQGNAATQAQPMDSSLNTPVRSGSTGYQTAPSNQFSGQVSVDGLKSCDQLVLDYLQQPSSIGKEKGIHRDELSQHLKVPVGKILEAIRSLEEEGLIYSTIDEFHYKSAAYG